MTIAGVARRSLVGLAVAALLSGCGGTSGRSAQTSASSTVTSPTPATTTTAAPPDVLGWFKAHRDDYRTLAAAIDNVNPAMSNTMFSRAGPQLDAACRAIPPAAGNLQLDLPTGSRTVDSGITAGLKLLRAAVITCTKVDVDLTPPQDHAVVSDNNMLQDQLSAAMSDVRGPLVKAGVPREVL